MSAPYVSVEKHNSEAVVLVKFGVTSKRFPLTKEGCLQAGRDLFKAGVDYWMNSSSTNHPKEVDKNFKLDVQDLLNQGYLEESDKFDAHRESLFRKMIDECGKDRFQKMLTVDEQEAFQELIEELDKCKR